MAAQSTYSLAFDGSSGYVHTPAVQGPQTAFTCSCWIKWTSGTGLITAMYDDLNGKAYLQFAVLSDGTLFARIQGTPGVIWIQRNSNAGAVTSGTWHHVAMTWDGGTTDAAIKSYVDGSQVDTTNGGTGSFSAPYAGTTPFLIGTQISGGVPNASFLGSIDDVAVFNTALTGGQFASIAGTPGVAGSSSLDVATLSPLWLYRMEEGSGDPQDSSGNGNNGTISGGVTWSALNAVAAPLQAGGGGGVVTSPFWWARAYDLVGGF